MRVESEVPAGDQEYGPGSRFAPSSAAWFDVLNETVFALAQHKVKFGDYKLNALGHSWQTIDGVSGVLVPGRQVYKIKRSRIFEAEEQRVLDDGSFQLGED